jgi:hypothetical protein
MLEKDLVRQILGYLKAKGAYCGKVKTMGVKRGKSFCFDPFLLRGMPDILCFYRNTLYFIEVKIKGNSQSPEQKLFQQNCISSSVNYLLAYTLDDVTKIVN